MKNEPKEAASKTIGDVLKQRRLSLRLSLAQVEIDTKIRGKYLTRLEASDYAHLPNDIYTKGFVAAYAEYLGLDAKVVVKQYVRERGGKVEATPARSLKPVRGRQLIVTPKLVVAGTFAAVAGLVIAYLAWQFATLAAAPKLELTSPTSDQVIEGSVVDVAGRVSGGADVLVNGSPILTDTEGRFSDKLALQEGVNTIEISAKNRLGKTTTLTRNILAKITKKPTEQLVPVATFAGVAVGVRVSEAVALIVEVDSKEAFRGTMLAGTSQSFTGTGLIKVTTSNAGVTSIVVTNSVVANKDLGALGGMGEVKRNLEFAHDTNFQ